jgi:hypothetical protein
MKTNELSGAALDWAVAKCEGFDNGDWVPDYSTDWAAGGPIIERERINLLRRVENNADLWSGYLYRFSEHLKEQKQFITAISGETALIAAMRCYVASKLGDEIELPEGIA